MYWDGEKHTYIPAAAGQSNTDGAPVNDNATPSDLPFGSPGSKDKKDKPKNKTAQQVIYLQDRIWYTDKCLTLSTTVNLEVKFHYIANICLLCCV